MGKEYSKQQRNKNTKGKQKYKPTNKSGKHKK